METSYFFKESIIGILLLIFIMLMLMLIPSARKFINKNIIPMMGLTFVMGFLLYLRGFWFGASNNFFSASLRAAVASLEMFASRSNLIEVEEELKEGNHLYMAIFSFVHFFAILLTLTFIIDLFGKRLVSRILAKTLRTNASGKNLYIFDGADDVAQTVAKSIPEDPNNRFIFVRGVLGGPETKSLSILDAILQGVKSKKKEESCESLGTVLYTQISLTDALANKETWLYKSVIKMLQAFKTAKVFLLTDDSNLNADAAYNLSNDLPEGLDVTIHAGVNTTKPHVMKLKGRKYIKYANRSRLVVDDLCETTPLMKEGKGKRTMIIGFGYTARRCIKVLAQEGFDRIDVIDPEYATRGEEFLCFNPSIRTMEGVRFFTHDKKSNAFWAYVRDNIDTLENVIVFGQERKANYEIAVNIIRYAQHARKDVSEFRVYMMEKERHEEDNVQGLYTFGCTGDIYTYERIKQTETE